MIRLRPRHVRARLTLWYVAVLATLLVLFASGTATFFFFSLRQELDANLARDFETVEGLLDAGPDGQVVLRSHHHDEDEVESEQPRFLEVWSKDGKLLLRSANVPPDAFGGPPHPGNGMEEPAPTSRALADGTRLRMVTRLHSLGGRQVVVRLAHSEERLWHELRELLGVVAFGIPAALAVAGVGGYLLARRALSPVDAMAKQAARISGDRLDERLPVENPHDELGQLALVLNQSLDRLQAAFAQLRRFTADASHELRTPLTAVRSVGEVALQDQRSPQEYREAIGSMLEEVDRLTRLVDSLLTLSRADASSIVIHRSPTVLMDVAREAAALVEVLAEEKHQELIVNGDSATLVSVDRLLLRQAVINLLDNAIQHSPPGATVRVRVVKRNQQHAVLEVEDQGPGIAAMYHEKIFERFFRTDPARSREQGGAGLGLAIADWAVRAHGGTIELKSEEGRGSVFQIVLPVVDLSSNKTIPETGGQT